MNDLLVTLGAGAVLGVIEGDVSGLGFGQDWFLMALTDAIQIYLTAHDESPWPFQSSVQSHRL